MLDVRKLFRPQAQAAAGEEAFDFSAWDFSGYEVRQPVKMSWQAAPGGSVVRLNVDITAQLDAECARCLEPARQTLRVQKEYVLREADLQEDFPELPILPGGLLDLEELAYGEIVMESPVALLCREDCESLCDRCGKPRAVCRCPKEEQGDPRLQVLRSLLQDEDEDGT